jgi:hypothetical protein
VIEAGLSADPKDRQDLTKFVSMLREARWQPLSERLAKESDPAMIDQIRVFTAVSEQGGPARVRQVTLPELMKPGVKTGDILQLEVKPAAPGWITVLALSGSNLPTLLWPRSVDVPRQVSATDILRVNVELKPPAEKERWAVVWTKNEVKGGDDPAAWWRWLEKQGLASDDENEEDEWRAAETISAEIVQIPRKKFAVQILTVVHELSTSM